jgi:hypothetical protein
MRIQGGITHGPFSQGCGYRFTDSSELPSFYDGSDVSWKARGFCFWENKQACGGQRSETDYSLPLKNPWRVGASGSHQVARKLLGRLRSGGSWFEASRDK